MAEPGGGGGLSGASVIEERSCVWRALVLCSSLLIC